MNQSQLDAIKRRWSRTTTGDWYVVENDLLGGCAISTINAPLSVTDPLIMAIADMILPENAEALACSKQDVADLIAEVENLYRLLERGSQVIGRTLELIA